MGQKVNPNAFRLPVSMDWESRWFVPRKSDYTDTLIEAQEKNRSFFCRKETTIED